MTSTPLTFSAAGYGHDGNTEYAYKGLANGLELDVPMRRLYRTALLPAERSGDRVATEPLDPGGEVAFLDFFGWAPRPFSQVQAQPVPLTVYSARPDLQRAFPDPERADFLAFASWAHHEVEAGRLDPRLATLPAPPGATRLRLNAARQLERVGHQLEAVPVPGTGSERVRLNLAGYLQWVERRLTGMPVPQAGERAKLNLTRTLGRLERRAAAVPVPGTGDDRVRLNMARVVGRVERRLSAVGASITTTEVATDGPVDGGNSSPGIRVAGYLRTESGVGQLGRLASITAQSAGIPTSTYLDTTAVSRQDHPVAPSGPDLNVNLVCARKRFGRHRRACQRVGPPLLRPPLPWGCGLGNFEEFPDGFAPAFDYVDEVWCISEFARRSGRRVGRARLYTRLRRQSKAGAEYHGDFSSSQAHNPMV